MCICALKKLSIISVALLTFITFLYFKNSHGVLFSTLWSLMSKMIVFVQQPFVYFLLCHADFHSRCTFASFIVSCPYTFLCSATGLAMMTGRYFTQIHFNLLDTCLNGFFTYLSQCIYSFYKQKFIQNC